MAGKVVKVAGRLKGKVAIVTGGAQGIGEGVSTVFARAGATVIVADLPKSPGKALVERLVAKGGLARWVPTDVTDPAQTEAVVAYAVREFGGLDILVNPAGILAFGTIATTDHETWDRVIRVNLTGTYNICHSALQEMIRRKGGSIVNFSSTTGANDVGANIAAYVASKGGVLMLTKSIAVDHAQDGIRANVIAPGPCDTPMLRNVMTDEELKAFGRRVPVGRVGLPEELGMAALFLASDEASFVTGALLYVDGGQAAQIGPILGN